MQSRLISEMVDRLDPAPVQQSEIVEEVAYLTAGSSIPGHTVARIL